MTDPFDNRLREKLRSSVPTTAESHSVLAGLTPSLRRARRVRQLRTGLAGMAAIVVTADHGMKPKHLEDGSPAVIYVQDLMDEWLGESAARVILPITDPYVVHHGALGSFATAYLPDDADQNDIITKLLAIEGITHAMTREEAVDKFELPGDRIGDVVMVSGENICIGTSEDRHDLAALKEPLRSHGGVTEQTVPFIVNRVLDLPSKPELRNFDAFFYAVTAAAM
jgi:phosphonoacetate hydrolase